MSACADDHGAADLAADSAAGVRNRRTRRPDSLLALTRRNNVTDPQPPRGTGVFGIDLGTTYSVVGYIEAAGRAGSDPQQLR
jgi:hypothetical protein